ncbi:MAG: acyl carrier protein [Flavobacteriales bacterium]|jgi:acyl carrier protein|nr:acyl carrier protein [Flavobacteriales bacterium]
MERQAIIEKIHASLVSTLGHENFEMSDNLLATDVEGWDSLTHMSILTSLEHEFGVKFKLREINKLKNMGSLIELIASKLS